MKRSVLTLASSCLLASTTCLYPAGAQSPTFLVKDKNPQSCRIFKADTVIGNCDAFNLMEMEYGEGSQPVEFLGATFFVQGARINLYLNKTPLKTTEDPDLGTINFHLIAGGQVKQPGAEGQAITTKGNTCEIAVDYSKVLCKLPNYSYFYIGNQKSSQPSGNSSQASNTFQTKSYLDTGISLESGDRITVNASGTINFGLFTGSGGPEGISFNPSYNYFNNVPHGHLVGRIYRPGMDEYEGWFSVGKGGEFSAESSGTLEFIVNDNKPHDNGGGFKIEVAVNP